MKQCHQGERPDAHDYERGARSYRFTYSMCTTFRSLRGTYIPVFGPEQV